ncbi:hypothetical protein ACQSSU_20710 [Micromonospora echinospora]
MLSTRSRYQVLAPLLTPLGYARYAVKVWRAEDHPRDPRTGRFIPKPGGPKRPRRPSARNHVASTRSWDAAERARKALPADQAGWRAVVRKEVRPAERRIDRRVAEVEADLAAARDALSKAEAELEAEFRRKRTPKARREQIANERLAEQRRDVFRAQGFVGYMRRLAEDPEALAKDPSGAYLAETVPPQVEMAYPKDPAGRLLPPDEYQKALDHVLEAGAALHADLLDAKRRDKDYNDLQRQLDGELSHGAIRKAVDSGDPGRYDLLERRKQAMRRQTRREQELLMQLLKSVRPFGGVHHEASVANEQIRQHLKASPPRPDWQERLREAEEFFPSDWLTMSKEKAALQVASSRRAFHFGGPGDKTSVLAMPTPERDATVYGGAFRDDTHDTNVHELGHRMEMTIPGLQELEFTFVRRRATADGRLEPLARIKDILRNHGYGDREVTYRDEWAHPYTGKSYELMSATTGTPVSIDRDPASRAWEVFQVGLQDTLGRTQRFGDEQLQHFTLGVLATLARSEPKPKRKRRASR